MDKAEEYEHLVKARAGGILNDKEFVGKTRELLAALRTENERYKAAVGLAIELDDVESIRNILRPLTEQSNE